jgi:hypothetical protein
MGPSPVRQSVAVAETSVAAHQPIGGGRVIGFSTAG